MSRCCECAYFRYEGNEFVNFTPICTNNKFITFGDENEPACEDFRECAGVSKWDSLTGYEREQYIAQFKHTITTSKQFDSILKVMTIDEAVEDFIKNLKNTDVNATISEYEVKYE